ncbi:MAG TPA: TMEM175 family protein [Ktedonobacteraceae bacterium]
MSCPRCGEALGPEYRFCPRCSLSLQAQPAQVAARQIESPHNPLQPHAEPAPRQQSSQPAQVYLAVQPQASALGDPSQCSQTPLLSRPAEAQARGSASIMPEPSQAETPRPAPLEAKKEAFAGGEESENERLLIFSDAVVAFAITIAAVPLKVPKELSQLQLDTFSFELLCYIFGFFLVYGLWKDHHSIFHYLKRNNTWLIALNTFFLALVVFIPVGFIVMLAAGLGNDPAQADTLTVGQGAAICLGSYFCANAILLLIWWSARLSPGALFGRERLEKPFLVYITRRLLMRLLSFVAYTGVVVLLFYGLWPWCLCVLALLLLIHVLFLNLYRRRNRAVLDLYLHKEATTRLQLFSDAIFAIAITITIAQVDPAAKVEEIWSLVGTYIFSLLILVTFWLLHYRVFHFVARLNSTLILLNFFFLLLVILAFIPARLYTSHMQEHLYAIVFSLYQLVTASVLFIMWNYARGYKARKTQERLLLYKHVTRRQRRRLHWVISANPCVFLLLALATCFTPVLPIFYVVAYLVLLGTAWLSGILVTLRLPVQTEPETASAAS